MSLDSQKACGYAILTQRIASWPLLRAALAVIDLKFVVKVSRSRIGHGRRYTHFETRQSKALR